MPRIASHIQNQTRTLFKESLLRGIESAVYTARDATAALKTVVELMDSVSTDRNGCSLVSYRSRQMGMAFIDSPLIIGKASLVVYRYTQGHGGF